MGLPRTRLRIPEFFPGLVFFASTRAAKFCINFDGFDERRRVSKTSNKQASERTTTRLDDGNDMSIGGNTGSIGGNKGGGNNVSIRGNNGGVE